MGIKDLFGGNKKKTAFREKAKEVMADGKIVPGKAEQLARAAKEHEIENPGDDKTMLRREIYNKAAANVKGRGKLTEVEAGELAKIQKFLALRDDQVEKTKWDVQRLRTLTEIKRGNLPSVPSNSSSMRGVQLEPDEAAHYSMSVEVLDLPSTRQNDGVRAEWGKAYDAGSAKMHVLPEDGAKPQGDASLVVTNRRLVIKMENGKIAQIRYSPQAQIHLYSDGIRLERNVGSTVLRFKSKSEETVEIVAELLAALMK